MRPSRSAPSRTTSAGRWSITSRRAASRTPALASLPDPPSCAEAHAGIGELAGAGVVLSAAEPPVAPPPQLRDRLMATIARTPQEPAVAARPATDERPSPLAWLRQAAWPRAVGIGALA